MRALSIRQPYAELILRGIKTIEYRSRATKVIGERFWIYASLTQAAGDGRAEGERRAGIWSHDLSTTTAPPPWIFELAEAVKLFGDVELPRGVIVGSAMIEKVERDPATTFFRWYLKDVERATTLRRPTGHPQPVWFRPF